MDLQPAGGYEFQGLDIDEICEKYGLNEKS